MLPLQNWTEIIKQFVPGYILRHFDYEKLEEMGEEMGGVIRIYLVEKTLSVHCGKKN